MPLLLSRADVASVLTMEDCLAAVEKAFATRDAFVAAVAEGLGVETVAAADIVITASSSQQPVFDGDWLKPGAHVNNIGSHSPGARELDTRTVVRSKFVADLKEANLAEAGDILIPIAEGAVTEGHIFASLGETRWRRHDNDPQSLPATCSALRIRQLITACPVIE